MIKKYIVFIAFFSISILQMNAFQVEPALKILKDYDKVRDFAISIDQSEAYVTAQSNLEERSVILKISKKNDSWKKIAIASFSGKFKDLEPFLSPDNLKLFFVSNRPTHKDSTNTKDFDIWVVNRNSISDNWSEPKNLGATVNTKHDEFYPSVSKNGNLYFTSNMPSAIGEDDIFVSRRVNGQYATPIGLQGGVNTKSYEYNAFISPNENYLIFGGYNRKNGYGSGDLYISFRNHDNTWTIAKNMGKEINSKFMDFCPFVTSDGQQLYFTSRRSNIEIFNELDSVESLLSMFNSYQNGFSRIYKTSFDVSDYKY